MIAGSTSRNIWAITVTIYNISRPLRQSNILLLKLKIHTNQDEIQCIDTNIKEKSGFDV